jgi:hypothetical protein
MHEHLEARLVQFADRHLQDQRVLKHAAGQPDRPASPPLPQPRADIHDHPCDRRVEPCRDPIRRHARKHIDDDRPHDRLPPDPQRFGIVDRKCIRTAIVRRSRRQRLETHGRLGLVGDRLFHAGQRSHGIEQPAHAARGDAVDIFRELLAKHASLHVGSGPHGREPAVPLKARRMEHRQRRPPRMPDARVAARQRKRREMRGPSECAA